MSPCHRRSGRAVRLTVAAAILPLVACGGGAAVPDVGPATSIPSPTGTDALAPFLSVAPGGGVMLAWTERQDTAAAVRFSRLSGAAFGAVRTVVERAPLFVNWADFASALPLGGDTVAAHWLRRAGDGKFAYGVQVAVSADDGVTWTPARWLHDDSAGVEHGFVTLWREPDGAVGSAWLDARGRAGDSGDGHDSHTSTDTLAGAPAMTVRSRRLRRDASVEAEALVDPRSCDCCQTTATPVADGMLLAWRDRSPTEIRDIVVARRTASGWSTPTRVHADEWETKACPVNGPSLASRGDSVVIAWFTQARDTAKVQVAFSADGGRTFGPAHRIDDGDPLGRVAVVIDDAGRAVVSWHERVSPDTADLRVRRVTPAGARSVGRTVTRLAATRRAGVSRMVRDGATVVFAWTVAGDHPTVALARASLGQP